MINKDSKFDFETNPFIDFLAEMQNYDFINVDGIVNPDRQRELWLSKKNFTMSMMTNTFRDKFKHDHQFFLKKKAFENYEEFERERNHQKMITGWILSVNFYFIFFIENDSTLKLYKII